MVPLYNKLSAELSARAHWVERCFAIAYAGMVVLGIDASIRLLRRGSVFFAGDVPLAVHFAEATIWGIAGLVCAAPIMTRTRPTGGDALLVPLGIFSLSIAAQYSVSPILVEFPHFALTRALSYVPAYEIAPLWLAVVGARMRGLVLGDEGRWPRSWQALVGLAAVAAAVGWWGGQYGPYWLQAGIAVVAVVVILRIHLESHTGFSRMLIAALGLVLTFLCLEAIPAWLAWETSASVLPWVLSAASLSSAILPVWIVARVGFYGHRLLA